MRESKSITMSLVQALIVRHLQFERCLMHILTAPLRDLVLIVVTMLPDLYGMIHGLSNVSAPTSDRAVWCMDLQVCACVGCISLLEIAERCMRQQRCVGILERRPWTSER